MPQRTAIAIRHVAFEDLGSFAGVLSDLNYAVEYREAGGDDVASLDPLAPDLLVVLGGPIGVNDAVDYPFIADELRLLERRLAAGLPTLGICLGSQLMAHALGARVYPAAVKEIGWGPLTLTDAGRHSSLRHLAPERSPVLHWHGDTFDLPAGATLLASTPICPNQAFSWGPAALALQFHVEVTAAGLERWFIGHTVEIAATPGISVPQLRAHTAKWAGGLEEWARKCLREWVSQAATNSR